MSHAHNRPVRSCRVSESREKHESLVQLPKLFSRFFCLDLANLSQMWLVCLLVVRSYFQMFCFLCFVFLRTIKFGKLVINISLFFHQDLSGPII